jgi:transcriptional regulator with XRE-family HTH domain
MFTFYDFKSYLSIQLFILVILTPNSYKLLYNIKSGGAVLFDARLKELREHRGLTQKDLAQRLNLTQSTIAYYENGKKLPTVETLLSLAKFFNVSTDFLLGISNSQTQNENTMQCNANAVPNYQTLPLTTEHKKLIRYYDRLNQENKEFMIGKMIEIYRNQLPDDEIARELERYRLELLSKKSLNHL